MLKTERQLHEISEKLDLLIIEVGFLAAILRREFYPPKKIHLCIGDEMADSTFTGVQTATVTISLLDASGSVVDGALIDPGTLTAAFADGNTSFTLASGADTSSFTVTSVAGAPPITADELTVNGSFNGVALTPGTLLFDIAAGPDVPVSISLSASTPA